VCSMPSYWILCPTSCSSSTAPNLSAWTLKIASRIAGFRTGADVHDRYRPVAEICGLERVAAKGPTEAVTERMLTRIDALLIGNELLVPRRVR